MTKSKPDTCVFIHDSPEEIKIKMNKAFCMEKEIEFNPVLNWAKTICFNFRHKLEIKRPKRFGGDCEYNSYLELENDFASGKIHPTDLKNAIAESLIYILRPAREHFDKPEIKEMLEEMEKLIITR